MISYRLSFVYCILAMFFIAPFSAHATAGPNAKVYAETLVNTAFDAYGSELDLSIARVAERYPPRSSGVLLAKSSALSNFCDKLIPILAKGANNVDAAQCHVFWDSLKNRLIIRASDYASNHGFSPNEAIERINGKIALLSLL